MAALEECKLCSCLPPEEMERVRRVAQERFYPAGQIIFQQGDEGDGIHLVKSGKVQISTLVGPDNLRPIHLVEEGDMFGEMAVIDQETRSATAKAEADTTTYFIPRQEMLSILEESPVLAVSLVREISRRLRVFNRQYVREVLQSERLALVGRFARSIVHDLKNPLNIIGLAADLAGLETATPETRKAARERIRKQVERISNMVNELLEFTRGGSSSFVLGMGDYGAFVRQLLEEIRPEAAAKSVEVVLENEPPSVKIPMNPQRLSRVFYNLVHNATDAMPQGGKIKVRFELTDRVVKTELEDTGPGIAPEIADKLFEAFVTYGKAQGTGLGLSICRRIIEDHHGSISARNSPGGGAIFAFTLPRGPS
jgi:signal transduction histidine kinase